MFKRLSIGIRLFLFLSNILTIHCMDPANMLYRKHSATAGFDSVVDSVLAVTAIAAIYSAPAPTSTPLLRLYPCRWEGCGNVFTAACDRDGHLPTHGEGGNVCRVAGCSRGGREFARSRDLVNHLKSTRTHTR